MKKFTLYTMLILGLITLIPTQSFATAIVPVSTSSSNSNEVPADVKIMLDRLEEIKEIDKSKLTRVEKKELRKEVKAIKASLKSSGNGVYLSIGAIIIIILLLILLL
jgi:Skp family chaperone for outer membrane proteins